MKKLNLFLVVVAFSAFNFQLSTFNCQAQSQKQLWGMTYNGGMDNSGVIFRTDGSGNNYNQQQTFWNVEGDPAGSLLQASDGKLYGMTYNGGVNSLGIIFQFDPATSLYTRKFDFDGTTNGSFPAGSLMQASDGKLYGMTSAGGANGGGVIFQYNPATNTFVKKIDLIAATGSNPYGSFIQASDGMLYGMTYSGGANSVGVIFQYNPTTNTYTKKIDLSATIGSYPYGSLIQAVDGMLYGMTSQGGANNVGVVFQYNFTTNTYTNKIDLTTANGANPDGTFTQTSYGILYGMTYAGGAHNMGVLFKYDPSTNTYTDKFDFDGTVNGSNPMGSPMQASDGNIYGMCTSGGTNNLGIIFQYAPPNSTFTKKKDLDATYGASPHYTSLIELTVAINTSAATSTICAGSSIKVPYTLTGAFDLGNVFTAQLSDASGNFASAVTIGSITNFANDTINCFIPSTTPSGTGYRIRVISSAPAITGSINGSNITINALPAVTANTTANTVCAGTAVTLTGSGAASYTWTGGVTDGLSFIPTTSVIYTVTGVDTHTCSNTATKTITVLPTSSKIQTRIICAGHSLTIGIHTYTTSATYHDTLTSSNGCDSAITTNLTILSSNTFSQTFTICAGHGVTVGTHTYTTSATYHDTLTSLVSGCDSMITTTLTILSVNPSNQSLTICAGSHITIGNHSYNMTGIYHDTLTSIFNGCDSIITTHLSIDSVNTSVLVSNTTLTANATGAAFQWIDCNNGNTPIAGQTNQSFTATTNGNYAVIVTQNNCSDTSVCHNITGIGIAQLPIDNYQVSIFPNPFNLQTNISFAQEQKNISIKIMDVLGKEIKEIIFSGKQLIIEKGEMLPGIYFVQIITERGIISKKLILAKN